MVKDISTYISVYTREYVQRVERKVIQIWNSQKTALDRDDKNDYK